MNEHLHAAIRCVAPLHGEGETVDHVVHQARALMASDAAVLWAVDDAAGRLVVKGGDGAVVPELRAAAVPARAGVAGKVLETRRPHWVRDYLDADDIDHDPVLDAAVAQEDLRSVLGVPVMAEQRVVGLGEA